MNNVRKNWGLVAAALILAGCRPPPFQSLLPDKAAQLVAAGGCAVRPPPGLSLPGFAFKNWYNAAAGDGPFNFSGEINGLKTVYARWETLPETLLDDFPYGTIIDPAKDVRYISNASDWDAAVEYVNSK